MATVIKAWMTVPPSEPECRLHVALVACNGGGHYHLYSIKEHRYETLPDADSALTMAIFQATSLYAEGGEMLWEDDTDNYDDGSIIRGEN